MRHMKEKESRFVWIKEHKKELIALGITAVGTILVISNWDSIKGMFRSSNSTSIVKIKTEVEKAVVPVIPKEILNNLTGNKLTATELGNKMWCSGQAINKKIVAAGLVKRLPNGGYSLTEIGRLLGEHTWKTTKAGHPFTNIEWDEKILEIIFNAEELLEIINKRNIVNEILGKSAA